MLPSSSGSGSGSGSDGSSSSSSSGSSSSTSSSDSSVLYVTPCKVRTPYARRTRQSISGKLWELKGRPKVEVLVHLLKAFILRYLPTLEDLPKVVLRIMMIVLISIPKVPTLQA